eukprot:TRINITY_DN130_c1_g2_i1.p3 TRINITY_DN130_c1_g2~~TRINITY_DN130_c1_g2_i1.p3  ORF type:complete len:147 (+),score=5.75 TRINITY_DN130_c1_g2_i1:111-551(+)
MNNSKFLLKNNFVEYSSQKQLDKNNLIIHKMIYKRFALMNSKKFFFENGLMDYIDSKSNNLVDKKIAENTFEKFDFEKETILFYNFFQKIFFLYSKYEFLEISVILNLFLTNQMNAKQFLKRQKQISCHQLLILFEKFVILSVENL